MIRVSVEALRSGLEKSILVVVSMLWACSIAADSYSDAERATSEFYSAADEIRNTVVPAQKRLVEAICSADEEERKNVARDASSNVRDQVRSAYERARRLRESALNEIGRVLNDEQLRDKRNAAEEMQARVNERWQKIEEQTKVYMESENPVAMQMLRVGQDAHKEYQQNSSNCSEYEWGITQGGRADCLNSARCEVIELKPNNSRAIYKGRGQAAAYAEVLNLSDDEFNKLTDRNNSFKTCKGQFKPRVACYTYCPEIDDEGRIRSTSIGWSMCD